MTTTNSKNQKIRIGMAQMNCRLGNIKENADKTIQIIEEYKDSLDLIIFPELSLTGYSVGSSFAKYAMRLEDRRLEKIMKRTQGVTIGVGMIEESPAFKFFNSLVFMRDGNIEHVHRKIYLPNYDIFEEKKYFSTGPRYSCFNLHSFRIAPFICGDAWNPALIHLAAADDANVLLISASSPRYLLGKKLSNKKNWQRLIKFYATMYGSYVVFTNRTGEERKLKFHGQSTLVDPFGKIIKTSKRKEGVLVAELNLSVVRKARTILYTMRDENLDFIHRGLNEIINKRRKT